MALQRLAPTWGIDGDNETTTGGQHDTRASGSECLPTPGHGRAAVGEGRSLSMPTDRKLLVFLSSTSDLKAERDAVTVPRSMDVYRYELDRARGTTPRDRLRQMLEQSDAFVGLHGARYGSLYPGLEQDMSIVEWEFDTARQLKRVELFPFVKANLPPDVDPHQRTFLSRLESFDHGTWVKKFESPAQLQEQVSSSLLDWLAEYFLRVQAAEGGQVSKRGRALPLVALTACTIGLGLVVAMGWASLEVSVALALVLLLATLACMTLI